MNEKIEYFCFSVQERLDFNLNTNRILILRSELIKKYLIQTDNKPQTYFFAKIKALKYIDR